MRLNQRLLLGGMIAFVLLMLVLGTSAVIGTPVADAPGGYEVAAGFSLVAGAAAMGGLVVLLLRMLVSWPATADGEGETREMPRQRPVLRWYWITMVACGWAGAFLLILSVALDWQWLNLLFGATLLLIGCGAAYQIARRLYL